MYNVFHDFIVSLIFQGQLNVTVNAMIPRLSDITRLLTNPPQKAELKTTSGTLSPPFGATRLSKYFCAYSQ